MELHEFTSSVGRIATYFNTREVSATTIAAWHPHVQHIPNGPIQEVEGILFTEAQGMPRNVPKALNDAWRQWQERNQSRVAEDPEARRGCPDQCNLGWIAFHSISGPGPGVFCKRCYPHSLYAMFRDDALQFGECPQRAQFSTMFINDGLRARPEIPGVGQRVGGSGHSEQYRKTWHEQVDERDGI